MEEIFGEVEKIKPEPGDFVMIRVPDKEFDSASPDVLRQIATDLERSFKGVKFMLAGMDYRLELINKTQLKDLGLRKIKD